MMWILYVVAFLLLMLLFMFGAVFNRYRKIQKQMPKAPFKQPRHQPQIANWDDASVKLTWIGHSTVYMNLKGHTIVTDPVLSDRVGITLLGLLTIGPKRHTAPATLMENLVNAKLILLSHGHFDHLDMPTLKKLARPDVTVVTAVNTSHLLRNLGFGAIYELGGTDTLVLPSGVKLTAVPVRHWGNRLPWNRDYGYTGYIVDYDGVRIVYAGDTAYTRTFTNVAKGGAPDVLIMPIGAYSPDSFQRSHCTPEQAWQMFRESQAQYLFPVHWDTFVLSHEPIKEPMERLQKAAGPDKHRIIIKEHGEVFTLPRT